MATQSPVYGFQLLQPSQSQPEVPINTALRVLEAMCSLSVVSRTVSAPPGVVIDGACYIVGFVASGVWAGMDGLVAIGDNGAWLFVQAKWGQRAYVQAELGYVRYDAGSPNGWIND